MLTAHLQNILAAFKSCRVLVIGDLMLDEYVSGDCSRVSPEAPVPVIAVGSTRAVLGGAANTAHNIASLGGSVTLVGVSGDDEAGRVLMTRATDAGIDFRPVVTDRPTVRKVRVVGQQQQLLRLDYESQLPLPDVAEARLLDIVTAELTRCAVVVISDYAKGTITERLCRELLSEARRAGKISIVDPRPQHASFYVGCDYLTPNWKESLGLIGEPERQATPSAVDEVGAAIARRFGSHVLMTLGPHGMKLFGRGGEPRVEETPAAREVFDVSGAGDTVAATFALALAAGCDEREAVVLANRAAGIVVGKLGTATVSHEELLGHQEDPGTRLVTRAQLPGVVAPLRSQRLRVVTVNGSFDLLHAGHLHILHEARSQGDVLIVGLNSDASVRGNKGATRPIVPQAERAALLLALRDVDFVHIFDEATPLAFLDVVGPDVHVNGAEYGENCVEAATVRAHGGRLHLVDRLPGLSSSDLLARVTNSASSEPIKLG